MRITSTYNGRNICLFESIGDGCLLSDGRLKVAHCSKQYEYLVWKRDLLKDNGIKTGEICHLNNKAFGKVFDQYYFRTSKYDFIKKYKKIIYNPKKDITMKSILRRLTPLGLAIWYMDDGNLCFKNSEVDGRPIGIQIKICTALPKEKNQILIDYFKEKWDINFHQIGGHKTKPSNVSTYNPDLWDLRAGSEGSKKFLDIVYPIVSTIPCMEYKVRCI